MWINCIVNCNSIFLTQKLHFIHLLTLPNCFLFSEYSMLNSVTWSGLGSSFKFLLFPSYVLDFNSYSKGNATSSMNKSWFLGAHALPSILPFLSLSSLAWRPHLKTQFKIFFFFAVQNLNGVFTHFVSPIATGTRNMLKSHCSDCVLFPLQTVSSGEWNTSLRFPGISSSYHGIQISVLYCWMIINNNKI